MPTLNSLLLILSFIYLKNYRATKWNELSDEVISAAISLGWDSDSWDKFLGEPGAYGKKWSQLRDEEKSAAYVLCHFNVTWPGDGSSINLVNQYDKVSLTSDAHQSVGGIIFPTVLAILFGIVV